MGQNIPLKILRKAAKMMFSREKEMNHLGRVIFWSHNPTYDDYVVSKKWMPGDYIIDKESFYAQRPQLIAEYGAGITEKDSNNAG